jgi:hypothetical protein
VGRQPVHRQLFAGQSSFITPTGAMSAVTLHRAHCHGTVKSLLGFGRTKAASMASARLAKAHVGRHVLPDKSCPLPYINGGQRTSMSAPSGREKMILMPDRVVETLETLLSRILERFGICGLANVCAQLCKIAREDTQRALSIGRSYVWLRALVFALLAGGIAILVWVLSLIDFSKTAADSVYSVLQGIEAAANLTLLTGAAMIFLLKLEERLKRGLALAALHELRSIVHVIDMHQLTKDPSKFIVGGNTPSSPPLLLNEFQMTRYLDYCSEMVSLTSKGRGAVCAEPR